ncbi:MAG: UDP-N-acetylmuramoyl-L-alanine--D-glutamate ligase [Oscillospiraceae bacterium]|nr:UDP-N-acetylmuramoyl-L-alanine--D-glutamate ligase [Oscillospiraceae bacterium]
MTLQEYIDSIREKSICVIGIGVSNIPLIEMLLAQGCRVTACDKHTPEEMGPVAENLLAKGAELKLGPDYLEDLHFDVIFRTPGLMPFDEHLERAKAEGAVITSEMEVFFRVCPCRVIAVTGSDGKTTTTTIISELLKEAGYTVHLGGNIGHPLLCEVPDMHREDIAVLELSSFQLHSMACKPAVSVITNISPNHLDKHKDFEDYVDAKKSIYKLQDASDSLVLNREDPHTAEFEAEAHATKRYFSLEQPVENGVFLAGGSLYRAVEGNHTAIMKADSIRIPGIHNVSNYMAAFAATQGLVSDEVCRRVAETFPGVEHRLETVRVLRGVTYINDSIGTSPTRTIAGLHALKKKPIILVGGYDKHIPFDSLGEALCTFTKAVIATGATADKILEAMRSADAFPSCHVPIRKIDDFDSAVSAAAEMAGEGDIVLLSPACAAFDAFANFAERGRHFKKLVMELQ